ncbi:MAG: hypothetical protein AVDCRST_MAG89-2398, partial [uncultured Gemmatimonadetes bacterium]
EEEPGRPARYVGHRRSAAGHRPGRAGAEHRRADADRARVRAAAHPARAGQGAERRPAERRADRRKPVRGRQAVRRVAQGPAGPRLRPGRQRLPGLRRQDAALAAHPHHPGHAVRARGVRVQAARRLAVELPGDLRRRPRRPRRHHEARGAHHPARHAADDRRRGARAERVEARLHAVGPCPAGGDRGGAFRHFRRPGEPRGRRVHPHHELPADERAAVARPLCAGHALRLAHPHRFAAHRGADLPAAGAAAPRTGNHRAAQGAHRIRRSHRAAAQLAARHVGRGSQRQLSALVQPRRSAHVRRGVPHRLGGFRRPALAVQALSRRRVGPAVAAHRVAPRRHPVPGAQRRRARAGHAHRGQLRHAGGRHAALHGRGPEGGARARVHHRADAARRPAGAGPDAGRGGDPRRSL